jgi:GDPmannose 4,6-dehydratase
VSGRPGRALVTGLTGQDGSFLAEQLLAAGHEVIGLVRRGGSSGLGASEHLRGEVELLAGDLLQPASLTAAVRELRPDELYHLAAPTFVPDSWRDPAQTLREIAVATATLLAAVRDHSPATRVLVASSGEIFGDAPQSPQREDTPCRPASPYATAKLAAHQLVGQLRAQAGLFACSAILFNHESERRPEQFVSRKITRAAAAIKLGLERELTLGDTTAVRDWCFAGDAMRGARLMLASAEPGDYVLASGVGRTVQQLVEVAFARVGLDPAAHVRVDDSLVRAHEPTPRIGDPERARQRLGWVPELSFEQLIERMVDHDLRDLRGKCRGTA